MGDKLRDAVCWTKIQNNIRRNTHNVQIFIFSNNTEYEQWTPLSF